MDFFIIALIVAINLSHAWSLKKHFVIGEMPKGAKILIAINMSCAITLCVLTFLIDQPLWPQIIGAAALIGSLILFWVTINETRKAKLLAAFDVDLPHGLVTTGPYKYVRHPFYTSYIFLWFGWALGAWHMLAIFPACIMFIVFLSAARDEEAKFARTDMAESYAKFQERTGRFFPKIFQ